MVMGGRGKWDWRAEDDEECAFWIEGSEPVLAELLRIVYVRGGAGEGEDDWQIVDE
jgi:hypothetical protein